ncbi:MAG: hypothetical protein QOF86_284 [Baekduia sp.]|nr:hypothetical protein [Baekduia sp.]
MHGSPGRGLWTGRRCVWTRRSSIQALVFVAAAAATSSPAAAAELPCARSGAAPAHLSTVQARHALLCLVNRERARHGLRAVRASARLGRAARGHAVAMARGHFFGHVSPGGATMQARVRRTGYLRTARAWWLGEALAWGRYGTGAPSAILASMLASPPHRAILLDPGFRDLGIGAVHGAPQGPGAGALTVALDFGRVLR